LPTSRADLKIINKNKILNSARTLFIEKGMNETTMQDVAVLSGLSRRTVYRFFAEKETLAYEVATIARQYIYKRDISIVLRGRDGFDIFKNYIEDRIEDHKGKDVIVSARLLTEYYNAFSLHNFKNERIKDISNQYKKFIAGLIRKGLDDESISSTNDPEVAAELFEYIHLSLIHRLIMSVDENDPQTIENSFEILKDFYVMFLKSLKS
jgi:AcrR family transcriptional regulator